MKKLITFYLFMVISISCSFGQDGWTTINLSTYKFMMGSTSLGTTAFFAGGYTSNGRTTDVEMYDISSEKWTYGNLSVARNLITAASSEDKVLFAGGLIDDGSPLATVDIYNTRTHFWSTAQLSQARFGMSAVSKGNKILFAGGGNIVLNTEYAVVDIYDASKDHWTTASLSEARSGMGAAVVGDLAIFAGGWSFSSKTASDRVDIYNFNTDTWSTATLSEPRFFIGATTVGNIILFGGGSDALGVPSKRVDIYDASTNSWSIDSLSVARAFLTGENVSTVCDKAYFTGGMTTETQTYQFTGDFNVIDIYDKESDTWTAEFLPTKLYGHSTISINDKLLIAGGGTISRSQIQLHKDIRIYTCSTVGLKSLQPTTDLFSVYPNPVTNLLQITLPDSYSEIGLSIVDMTGKIKYASNEFSKRSIEVNTEYLPDGVYVIQIKTGDILQSQKFIVTR